MIKIKRIQHGESNIAPFIGAVVSNVDNGDNELSPFGMRITDVPNIKMKANQIVKEITNHKDNKGIILGGFDWCQDIGGLISILEEVKKTDLHVMIQVPCTIKEFEKEVGKYGCKKYDEFANMERLMVLMNDDEVYDFIGMSIMQELINEKYMMSCGLYEDVMYYALEVDDKE